MAVCLCVCHKCSGSRGQGFSALLSVDGCQLHLCEMCAPLALPFNPSLYLGNVCTVELHLAPPHSRL